MDLRNWHHERRWRPYCADLHREVARLRARAFARYRAEVRKDELDDPNWEAEADEEESTRPFSAAVASVKKRVESRKSNPAGDVLGWTPSSRQTLRRAPSLLHLCLMSLVKHGEEIESLEGIPDDLKHKIVSLLCSNRKMNSPEKLNLAELYIDNCQKIDVMQILPALETMEHLEVLSVAARKQRSEGVKEMEGGGARDEMEEAAEPRDARVVKELLRSMGLGDGEYEPRVVHQFLELAYRYVVEVLSDAQIYSDHASKTAIDPDDVRLAIQSKVNFSFSQPPPREVRPSFLLP
ncbi:hypothetical protein B296_00019462 [Ensete ventricosum]|uniref:Transcription initiation factor TFIID subunit 9 n=1 Tax=Ensete ventricosum TaxID=4639 RepID=A0A427ANE9_ENSVE|nr:hypothetical protein B296_00019462 [Ensete ventricosum]